MFNKIINRLIQFFTVQKHENMVAVAENAFRDSEDVSILNHYGFYSNLPEGTRVFAINSNVHSIGIASESEFRPRDLSSGDVVIYDNKGNKIELTDGKIIIAGKRIEVNCTDVNISGNLKVNGSVISTGDVKAGSISLQKHTHYTTKPGDPTLPPTAGI